MQQLDTDISQQLSELYIIQNLLGKGAFGNVYQCIEKATMKTFALKIISKINVRPKKIITLKQQAKLLQQLSHENVVKIYQYGQFQNCIYIQMQKAQCGNLQLQIDKRKRQHKLFTDDQASSIIKNILQGLSYIHSLNIIHRDMKPQNILLWSQSDFGILKIADFGLSTKLDFHYPKSTIGKVGTILFMAPEIHSKYSYTKAIDIWSIAIMMFILLTGKHPFWTPKITIDQFKNQISTSKNLSFPKIEKISKLAQDFLERISKLDPHERYTAQQALKHPWITRKFQDEIPLSVHQSYSGFSNSHEISKIMKIFMVIKDKVYHQKKEIPTAYLNKVTIFLNKINQPIENYNDSSSSFHLRIRKIKSLSYESSLLSTMTQPQNLQQKKHRQRKPSEDSPTIKKLNQIFNQLFDKRTPKITIYNHQKQLPKDNVTELPNIEIYKKNIEDQIQRSVTDFLIHRKNKNRRILPLRTIKEKIPSAIEQFEQKSQGRSLSFIRKLKNSKKFQSLLNKSIN